MSDFRGLDPTLPLVLSLSVRVGCVTLGFSTQEYDLRDALPGVDREARARSVHERDRDEPFPFGLERRDVDDEAAASVGRLAIAEGEHVARNTKVFERACQHEAARGNHTSASSPAPEPTIIDLF